jgi:peptidylprolyl isomerase
MTIRNFFSEKITIKKIMIATLSLGVFIMITGCDQQEQTANKSQQENKKSLGYVETLASINTESRENIAAAVKQENENITKAKEALGDETQQELDNNLQNSTTMENIPEEINMEFAKTCKKATIKTNKGDVVIAFYNADAPVTVANFCTLADKGFYDNLIFHRVIKNFMIQGGDPKGTGFGGPDYKFDDEIHANNENKTGTIAMANSGPGTNGSQFFINVKDNNSLDTKHTVFGEVVEGSDVVTEIENTEVGAKDKPIEDIIIESVVIGEIN